MYFGTNLQYLRRCSGNMTQERLAQHMAVSRQTVSKWESGDSIPEPGKLIALCELFSCTLDALVRTDMTLRTDVSDPVRIEYVQGFRHASYTVISRNAAADARNYMASWAEAHGLSEAGPTCIGWDFPYVSQDQKRRFGLRGYVAAIVLPQGYGPDYPGVDYGEQESAHYAVMTIQDPFAAPYDRISRAYGVILEYLNDSGLKKKHCSGILPCFQRIHEKDGVTCMDLYIHCQVPSNVNIDNIFI